jgi:hypothetical protein
VAFHGVRTFTSPGGCRPCGLGHAPSWAADLRFGQAGRSQIWTSDLLPGISWGPGEAERDWAYLDTWLQPDYAIVVADYAGLGTPGQHPYPDGIVEAHNVVDAVRAATEQYSSRAKKWVVVGRPQGGGAAVYTARYASEFGGPPPRLPRRGRYRRTGLSGTSVGGRWQP